MLELVLAPLATTHGIRKLRPALAGRHPNARPRRHQERDFAILDLGLDHGESDDSPAKKHGFFAGEAP